MKIIFVNRRFYPHVGGVEKHTLEIASLLSRKGHEVTVVAEKYDSKLKEKENLGEIEILRLPIPKVKFFGLLTIWSWVIKNRYLFKKADIVHVNDVVVWVLPLKLFSVKLFGTFHGWRGIYPIPVKDKLIRKLERESLTGAIGVGKRIEKHYGIKCDFITHGGVSLPEKSSLKEKKIVYVGSLKKDRGADILLGVLAKLKGYEVDFCGDGELRKKAETLGTVHGFTDPTPFEKKAEMLFCSGYLSMMEGFANKCLVVSSYQNKARKDILTLTPFCDWMVIGGSQEEIVRKIKSLKKAQKEEMISRAYSWVKGETWESLASLYGALWEEK